MPWADGGVATEGGDMVACGGEGAGEVQADKAGGSGD